MARWNRKHTHSNRSNNDDDQSSNPSDQSDLQEQSARVSFKDADPDTDEVPLSELDNFFIPGRDEKGASQAITVHVPPYLARLINVLVHSKRFPYVSPEDLIRHSVVRQVRWLNSIRKTIQPQMVPAMEAIIEANRDAEFRIKTAAAFKQIDIKIDYFMRNGEVDEAIKLVSFIMHRVNEVQASAKQREFIKTLLMKYSPVMAGVKGWEEELKKEPTQLTDGKGPEE